MNPFDLYNSPREFGVYNPSEEPVELGYDGETRIIPSRDNVVSLRPGNKFASHSCVDTEENLVPGTLVIMDMPGARGMADGGRPDYWSAAAAIRDRLGIDPESGNGKGAYYEKGISLISTRPTPDEVESVRATAAKRYEQFMVKWAAHVQDDVVQRGMKYKSVGMNFVMSPKEHMELAKAEALLKAAEVKYRNEALQSVGLLPEDEGPDLESFVATKAAELAAAKATNRADMEALASELAADPEFKKILKKMFWDGKKRAAKTPSSIES